MYIYGLESIHILYGWSLIAYSPVDSTILIPIVSRFKGLAGLQTCTSPSLYLNSVMP